MKNGIIDSNYFIFSQINICLNLLISWAFIPYFTAL